MSGLVYGSLSELPEGMRGQAARKIAERELGKRRLPPPYAREDDTPEPGTFASAACGGCSEQKGVAAAEVSRAERARRPLPQQGEAQKINKYRNQKTITCGIWFDSRKEAGRFLVLRARYKEGEIRELRLQEEFLLKPSYRLPDGTRSRAVKYVADFTYLETSGEPGEWRKVVEDVKSRPTRTQKYIIKKKLMQQVHGITIREI